jgi:hypothetical protein
MPNPNVLASYLDEVNYYKYAVRMAGTKSLKEQCLRQLREAAAKAGVNVPAYNTSEFATWLAKDEQ